MSASISQAVTVISRADVDARGVDTIAEAMRYSPGVAADHYGPDGRGFEWIQLRNDALDELAALGEDIEDE